LAPPQWKYNQLAKLRLKKKNHFFLDWLEEGGKGGKGITTGVGRKSQDAVLLEINPKIFLNANHFSFGVILSVNNLSGTYKEKCGFFSTTTSSEHICKY
jgi:hypothetical protein